MPVSSWTLTEAKRNLMPGRILRTPGQVSLMLTHVGDAVLPLCHSLLLATPMPTPHAKPPCQPYIQLACVSTSMRTPFSTHIQFTCQESQYQSPYQTLKSFPMPTPLPTPRCASIPNPHVNRYANLHATLSSTVIIKLPHSTQMLCSFLRHSILFNLLCRSGFPKTASTGYSFTTWL